MFELLLKHHGLLTQAAAYDHHRAQMMRKAAAESAVQGPITETVLEHMLPMSYAKNKQQTQTVSYVAATRRGTYKK